MRRFMDREAEILRRSQERNSPSIPSISSGPAMPWDQGYTPAMTPMPEPLPTESAPAPTPNVKAPLDRQTSFLDYQGVSGTPPSTVERMSDITTEQAAVDDTPVSQDTRQVPEQPRDEIGDFMSMLRDAQQRADNRRFGANIAEAFATFGQQAVGREFDPSFYRNLGNQAEQEVKDVTQQIEAQTKLEDRQREIDRVESITNPDSEESKNARALIESQFPSLAKTIENFERMSVEDLDRALPYLKLKTQLERASQKEGLTPYQLANLDMKRQAELRRVERDLDQDTRNYARDIERTNIPQLTSTIEATINLLPDNPKDDIPGYGRVAGMIPDVLVSEEGENLRQVARTLFNITLQDRSGAAVTDQELERLRKEFGEGSFKSDEQFLRGLYNYARRLKEVSRNVMAGTDPKAAKEYEKRLGTNYLNKLDQLTGNLESILKSRGIEIKGAASSRPTEPGQVRRRTNDGRIAIFNSDTKEFIRFEDE